ncbi:hypothetical protein IM687_13790 [Stutzerimonas stutzeri]|jgi:hypothetical protein|uniref:hypothetical protein n=1 Tax=Stutzerimonas stutzeri TaxID=316 RepID=UPI0018A9A314|nr:hypothetical protein [Stutzerimonas stutzeri]QPI08267.1 hypothetical protein IM687_13790 [Stutzerimonas stutzeri]
MMSLMGPARGHNTQNRELDFDLERMARAVHGGSIRIPSGMNREARRKWIRENAGKCSE